MKLQRFNIHEDLRHINDWLVKRGKEPVTRHDLPELGYIAMERTKPMGAIFLRRCEGNLGMVDSLISNPDESPEVRDFVVESLIKHIVEVAKTTKLTTLIGFTVDNNTMSRSIRLGFVQSPQTVVVMDLLTKSEI